MILNQNSATQEAVWPSLPLAEWQDTYATLHMWTQMVGKVRLALSPHVNHWWEVPLYVTARGLTTSPIPYGMEIFEIRFDFMDHQLNFETSWGEARSIPLVPMTVADFYQEFMTTLYSLGIQTRIWPMPVEVPDPIRFDKDHIHGAYDAEYAHRFWRTLVTADMIFKEFRSGFIGKDSPVHFFWGSFDICVTRFSGRRAPERTGADFVTREAYSHEASSVGFWPGTAGITDAAFYAYAAPEPAGFSQRSIEPKAAFYEPKLREFLLPYEDVRTSASPKADLLAFCQSTYEAGADLAHWDRAALEKQPPTRVA